jgi:hypothetical protein
MHHIQILSIEAARWAIKCSPNLKVSNIATREVDEKVLSVFGEGILRTASNKRSALKALGSKLKQIYQAFQKAPQLWAKFKEVLGIKSNNVVTLYFEFSRKFQKLLDQGSKWWSGVKSKLSKQSKIMHFLFLYASQAPTLSGVLEKIVDA